MILGRVILIKPLFSRNKAGAPGYSRRMLVLMAWTAILCLLVFAFLAWQLRLGACPPLTAQLPAGCGAS